MTKNRKNKKKERDDWINSTRFWRVLGSKFMDTISRQIMEYQLTKDSKILLDSFWTQDEKKIMNIYHQLTAVLNHISDIRATIRYIKFKGLKVFLKKNNLSENEYLKFVYENHQIPVSSTPDICAKLADIIRQGEELALITEEWLIGNTSIGGMTD